ncbi:hypothetical protein [Francisella frigiditurris]|uniref:Uncharacterized protein n=1 Tax=Francisella frigiditurris TaxID=1542390 RepID=A0A1J0KSY8_9GAMM|nr:hypothetical protein [Francisella frigiditurris]APC96799.1 hypothetical protein KX01_1536 [Francisella frigiditurris]
MQFRAFLFLFFLISLVVAYEIDENGKEITVTDKNAVNAVDDVEMQEGESLTNQQVVNIVKYVEAKDQNKKTDINISDD